MARSPCDLCGGTKHRYCEAKAAWVPCECLRGKRSTVRYRRAGIPERFDGETWASFLSSHEVSRPRALVEAAKVLSEGCQPAGWILIHGRPTRARALAVALLLRSACDGRLEARALDVPSLIDAEFTPGRGRKVYETDVLAVEVGGEPKNKWNRHVLEKALRDRWSRGQFTILVTEGDPSRLAAGYGSGVIEESLSEKFSKVRVAPKEGS